jgi:hypothetical protein
MKNLLKTDSVLRKYMKNLFAKLELRSEAIHEEPLSMHLILRSSDYQSALLTIRQ